jgi:hypothetical protein
MGWSKRAICRHGRNGTVAHDGGSSVPHQKGVRRYWPEEKDTGTVYRHCGRRVMCCSCPQAGAAQSSGTASSPEAKESYPATNPVAGA